MKRKLLLPVLALTAFLGTLLSCSSDSGTASIQIPVTQIFRNVEDDLSPSDTNKIKLEITLSGDAKDRHEFNWEEKEQNCTFENLPVGGVVSVSAKVKDGEDLIYSGVSDKIKLKNEQNETTIKMERVNGDASVKIQALPTPELEAKNGNTFSLTQDTALFKIYYIDSSNPDINPMPKPLPDWVTYKWMMNGTEFTPDDASTPNDGSGQATFGKNKDGELILTIYLNKMKSLLYQGPDVASQNRLYVEIGMENSEETKSTEIEFTITQ